MKYTILLLFLLVSTQVFADKKPKVDPNIAKIDSLTTLSDSLTLQLDSVNKQKEIYYGVFTLVKEKIFKLDFDPANATAFVDSLLASDSTYNLTMKDTIAFIAKYNVLLKAENDSLKIVNDKLTFFINTLRGSDMVPCDVTVDRVLTESAENIVAETPATKVSGASPASAGINPIDPTDKSALVKELKQLKELLDAGIFTKEDFESKKKKVLLKW